MERYLSRLYLNPRHRSVRRDLGDCQQLHRTVLSAFPPAEGGAEAARARWAVLHRVDRLGGRPVLYVQSAVVPDWSRLPAGYLAADAPAPNPACKEVGSRYAAIRPGTELIFRLRANVTRKIDTKSGPDGRRRNGRRVPLRRPEEQLAWLERKAASAGFAILSVRLASGVPDVLAVPSGRERGRITGVRGGAPLTFEGVTFSGRLQVVDAERFREALANGIGPGKAYGFGLLSVAPAGRSSGS